MTKSPRRVEWNDLQVFLAVADAGSLSSAARLLNVNHTTVFRRIQAFEKHLGLRLFDRMPSGYTLTPGGVEMLAAARDIESTVSTVERKLTGQDLKLSGTLRITTTDTLAVSLIPPVISEFVSTYPDVNVELSISNAFADLSKRDADIAIRPTANPPPTLVGRKVWPIEFGLYASQIYIEKFGGDLSDYSQHSWLAPDTGLAKTVAGSWITNNIPAAAIRTRADSFVTLSGFCAVGMGIAVLPTYLVAASSGLSQLGPVLKSVKSELWILTHEDLRGSARVRTFTELAYVRLLAARNKRS